MKYYLFSFLVIITQFASYGELTTHSAIESLVIKPDTISDLTRKILTEKIDSLCKVILIKHHSSGIPMLTCDGIVTVSFDISKQGVIGRARMDSTTVLDSLFRNIIRKEIVNWGQDVKPAYRGITRIVFEVIHYQPIKEDTHKKQKSEKTH